MIYKSRTEAIELLILKSLNNRMDLSEKEKQHYVSLKKGYEGELLFDTLTEKLQCDCLILNDLLLKNNSTLFQIDSLIITSDTIFLYEVKNYEGDYFYETDKLYIKPKTEISNPLTQLSRCESLLRQLLLNQGFTLPIDASVIFINPEFTLYQAPLNKPIILPTQVNRHMNKLNLHPSRITSKHKMLADKLVNLHNPVSPYNTLPSFDYCQLRKGVFCEICNSFSISVEGQKCVCKDCWHEEAIAEAVMRNVREIKLLFPDRRITTGVVHEWCQVVDSKKRIKRILERHFKIVGVRQWAYYV